MTTTPGEDDFLGLSHDGSPITRRSMREAHEQRAAASEEFTASMRRLLGEELSLDQLFTMQQLFTDLALLKEPSAILSWWEGQIDALVWARNRAETTVPPIPEVLGHGALTMPDEVDSAVVEGTYDRHDFQPLDRVADLTAPLRCVFTSLPADSPGPPQVCGLQRDAYPHTR